MDQKKRLHSIARGVSLESHADFYGAWQDLSHCITYFGLNLALQVDRY